MKNLRVVTLYKSAGTRSFRLAAAKFDDYGMNLQNPDKHTMDMCVAPRGFVIVQADQSGAEALIVSELAKAGKYRALFDNGVKPHTYLAGRLFPQIFQWIEELRALYFSGDITGFVNHPAWPILHKAIKKSGNPYDIGKRTAHGSSYRMGPITFRDANLKQSYGKLRLTIAECRLFLDMFKELFPEIVEWQNEIELTIRATRKLTNLFGYERAFERTITESYIREGISWIPQSTVGCITHHGIRAARREHLSVCSNKHDSYAVICKEDEAKVVAQFMRQSMSIVLPGRDRQFTMKSETQVGKNWAPCSETNPEGMAETK